jgi:hypothetical protein
MDVGEDAAEEKAGDGDGNGYDYDNGDDGGLGDDGGMPVDEDLGDDFGFVVPAGMCVCGMTGVDSTNFPASFDRKGRVCFKPGTHRMQKDMRSFQLDLIESVEVGPEAVVGTPSGVGIVTVSPPAQPGGEYSFMFEQEFDAGGAPFVFSMQLVYASGVEVVTMSDAGLCDRLYWTGASWGGTPLYMGTCQYSLFYCGIVKFNLQGGGWLKVENCNYCPKDWMCKANNGGMRRAEFSSGSGSINTDNYFGLVHSWRHHNWGNDSLARFDQALGGVQAVYVGSNQYPDHNTYSSATLLDGDLNVIETRPVTGVEYLDQW